MSTISSDTYRGLNPATSKTLQNFERRRKLLLILRSIAILVVTFVAAMLLIAMIDYFWLLTDSVRWTFSMAGYAVTAGVTWWFGLRHLFHQDPKTLAQQVESTEPRLGDDLLSAVELSNPEEANGSDSFRNRLQERVGRRVSTLNVSNLLPIGLIRKSLTVGSAVLALFVLMMFIPSLQFGRRMARAMLPGVAIERASRTIINIVEPFPASDYVAEGDAVAVIVEVSGEPADDAMLDWRAADGNSGQTQMTPRISLDKTPVPAESEASSNDGDANGAAKPMRYAANLPVGSVPVDYRITAGDAITLWHTLTPLPRPRVKQFEKRFEFPTYAQLNERTEIEEHGDLKALAGTTAHVKVMFDEPVTDVAIRYGSRGAKVPLTKADESGLAYLAEIALRTPGQYQIDAVSVRSGLDNPFSPSYSITPLPDSAPIVRWASQIQNLQLISPLEVMRLAVSVRDDLPVDKVFQEFQVNEDVFKKYPVGLTDPARELELEWEWDLLKRKDGVAPTSKLSPGDIVRVRAVAIDRRGQRSETEIIDLLIADEGFKSDRHAHLDELSKLAESILEWVTESEATNLQIKQTLGSDDLAGLAAVKAKAVEAGTFTETAIQKLSDQLERSPNVHEAGLLELIGRVVLDVHRRQRMIGDTLDSISELDAGNKNRKRIISRLKAPARSNEHQTTRVGEVIRSLVAQHLTVGILNDAVSLSDSLTRLTDDDAAVPVDRYPRYLKVTTGRLKTVSQLVDKHSEVLPSSTLNHFQGESWDRWAERWLIQFDQAIENPPGALNYRALVRSFREQLNGKIQYGLLDGRLSNSLTVTPRDMRRELYAIGNWIESILEPGSQALTIRERAKKEDNTKTLADMNGEIALLDKTYRRNLSETIDKINSEQTLHRRRPTVDLQYAADLALLKRALTNVNKEGFAPYKDESAVDVHRNLSHAIKVIEAHHEATAWNGEIRSLLARERRMREFGDSKFMHPVWLERYTNSLEWSVGAFQQARLPSDAIEDVAKARYDSDFATARDRITRRRWDREKPVSAESALAAVDARLSAGLQSLIPEVVKARESIRKYVLTLSEQAREAAAKAKEAEKKTDDRQDSSKEKTQELAQEQKEAEEAAKDTIEMLVDKANTADILNEAERELARDADAAAAQIQDAIKEAEEAIDQATKTENEQVRSDALEKSEKALEKLAETLEQTADHFERAENNQDLAETREELRKAEEALNIDDDLDERYESAEKMAEAAQQDPKELMRQLEQELQENELMQNELSEISERAAENAQQNLEQAARDDKEVGRSLERADSEFQEEKRRAAKQLAQLARRAQTVENAIMNTAEQALGWANDQESREKASQARKELRESLQEASEKANENSLLSEMNQAAKDLSEAVNKAKEAVEEIKKEAAENTNEEIHNDEKRRKQTQTSMERQASNLRNRLVQALNSERQQWQNEINQSRVRENTAKAQAREADKQLSRVEEQLKKDKENAGLKEQQKQLQQRKENAQQVADAAKETREFAEQQRKEAEQRTREVQKQKLEKLESKNPAAQLAENTSEQSESELSEIGKKLAEMAKDMGVEKELQVPAQQAERFAEKQARISEDVDAAAEDLDRAARHEDRLNKPEMAEQLAEAAKSVQENAGEPSREAEQALKEAAQSEGKAAEASQEVGEAAEQIAQEAQKLGEMLGENQQQAPSGENQPQNSQQQLAGQQPTQGSPSEEAQQRAQQLAQTLDELDRAMAQQSQQSQGEPQQGQPQNGQPQDGQPQNGQPQQGGEQGQPGEGQPQSGQPSEGQPGQQPGSPSAAQASPTLQSMLDAQNQNAARERLQQMQPSQQNGKGQPGDQEGAGEGERSEGERGTEMPDGPPLDSEFVFDGKNVQWGQLRERRTDDAGETRGTRIAPQYRREVEAYFKAIAKRAAEKAK